MRIDKFLQLTCHYSKQEIQSLIKNGQVTIDGQCVFSGKTQCFSNQQVSVYDHIIEKSPYVYYMLNKPQGYISALKDTTWPTVMDLINEKDKEYLRIMGRLDKDTTGLMILTNNTQAISNVTLPQSHIPKKYAVTLREPLDHDLLYLFEEGIIIDGNVKCQPATIEVIDPTHVYLTIYEGRYHQVKKMFLSLQNEVIALKRIQMNELCLDPHLPLGHYRQLSKQEVDLLLKNIKKIGYE